MKAACDTREAASVRTTWATIASTMFDPREFKHMPTCDLDSRPVRLHLPPDRRRQPGQGRRGDGNGGRCRGGRRRFDRPVRAPGGPDSLNREATPRQRSANQRRARRFGPAYGDGASPAALDVVGEHAGADGGGAAAAEDDPLPPPPESGR